MDTEEKRETYEVARRAVRDEVRAMVHDFVATIIGVALFVSGLIGTAGRAVRGSLFTPETGITAFVGLIGVVMIAITWKWDRWLRQYLPSGGVTRR